MISSTSMADKEGLYWIYLSPHLDDAALSCGGLIWEQVQAGAQVSIWTICAGDPPDIPLSPFAESLHRRWQVSQDAAQERRLEDVLSCQRLGASFHHFTIPDCIYRQSADRQNFLYDSENAIFGPIHSDEACLIEKLSEEIASRLPVRASLVSPLALGGHVDHRLTRAAAEHLGWHLWFYPDYPYVVKSEREIDWLRQDGWDSVVYSISPAGLAAWQESIAAHASQISTFWPDLDAMRAAIKAYKEQYDGLQLLRQDYFQSTNLQFE